MLTEMQWLIIVTVLIGLDKILISLTRIWKWLDTLLGETFKLVDKYIDVIMVIWAIWVLFFY